MPTVASDTGYQYNQEQLLEAGRAVYERLPVKQRPVWAAEILALASSQIAPTPQIETLIRIAQQPYPGGWYDAEAAFSALRNLTLKTQDPLNLSVLMVAENAAKVIFNAYVDTVNLIFYDMDILQARYNEDAGWWLFPCLKMVADRVNNPEFTAKAFTLFDR